MGKGRDMYKSSILKMYKALEPLIRDHAYSKIRYLSIVWMTTSERNIFAGWLIENNIAKDIAETYLRRSTEINFGALLFATLLEVEKFKEAIDIERKSNTSW